MAENQLQVEANNGVIVIQMYATLDPDSSGGYNEALNREYAQMAADNDFDFQKTNRMAMEILKEKICRGYDRLPALLFRKGKAAYCDNSNMIWWALVRETGDEFKGLFSWIYPICVYIDKIFYLGIVSCMIVSAIFVRDKHNYFILLCVLGGCLASLLVESQGRYKYSIEPLWCVPSAYGIYYLGKLDVIEIIRRAKSFRIRK